MINDGECPSRLSPSPIISGESKAHRSIKLYVINWEDKY